MPQCPTCEGTTLCRNCRGTGRDVGIICEACDEDGNGKCGSCSGTGVVSDEGYETLTGHPPPTDA